MNTQTDVIYHAQEDYAKSTQGTNTGVAGGGTLATGLLRLYVNSTKPTQNEDYHDHGDPTSANP
ncbi:MAG: hypothetical protein DME04_26525 [Candidatus Rokuibacteriota bacterium]|nr:MAG: hypothetical protein DME04_26525 [Candidatus Rokubacteria bacterium]